MGNSIGHTPEYDRVVEDFVMLHLPTDIKDYILYSAPVDVDVVHVFKIYRAGIDVVDYLRRVFRDDTIRHYCPQHPGAST